MNSRFHEKTIELLSLSHVLWIQRDSTEGYKYFDICELIHKFNREDFTECETEILRIQLHHFEIKISKKH